MFGNFHSCARSLLYLLRRAHRCFTALFLCSAGRSSTCLALLSLCLTINTFESELTLHLCPVYSWFMTHTLRFTCAIPLCSPPPPFTSRTFPFSTTEFRFVHSMIVNTPFYTSSVYLVSVKGPSISHKPQSLGTTLYLELVH